MFNDLLSFPLQKYKVLITITVSFISSLWTETLFYCTVKCITPNWKSIIFQE